MSHSPLAGHTAPLSMLVNLPRLVTAYYSLRPDPSQSTQRVAFGTSGHRGNAFNSSFNEQHVLAITQAICDHRRAQGSGRDGVFAGAKGTGGSGEKAAESAGQGCGKEDGGKEGASAQGQARQVIPVSGA